MGRIWGSIARTILILTLASSTAWGVRPTDQVIEKLKREGKWDQYVVSMDDAHRRGLDQPDEFRLAAGAAAPVLGNLNVLVILVDFSDNPASANVITDSAYFADLLFSTNVPKRSMNDFYEENSYGKVTITGDIVGWLRMDTTYAYYVDGKRGIEGIYPHNAQKLAEDAIAKADAAGVDFSKYDNNGDTWCDGVVIVHAGPGYEETGNPDMIHSHKWVLSSSQVRDGVTLWNYTMQPEERVISLPANYGPVNIGVFCHEFGHFLGLPDFYDTDYSSQGMDKWILMAGGNYAKQDGSSPAHFSAWSKIRLGWISPVNVTSNMVGASIPQVETDSTVYRLWTGGAIGSQYYLVENRQKVGFDTYLPGTGLFIYHVDDTQPLGYANNDEWYPGHTASGNYLLALEQADGLWELEKTTGTGGFSADNGDPYPGFTNNTSFDDMSVPNSRAYSGVATQVAVWNISPSGPAMTANLDVTWSRPNFKLVGRSFADDGNSNGIPDPGENVSMTVTETNYWKGVTDAVYSVSTNDSNLSFTDSVRTIGLVSSGSTRSNTLPITFSVPGTMAPRIVDFYITVTAEAGAYVKTDTVRIDIGPKRILLVDDDGRYKTPTSLDSAWLIPALDSIRIPWGRWENFTGGTPGTLANYDMVFWYTGNKRDTLFGSGDTLLTPSEIAALKTYLDGGGNLFLTGQQIAHYLDSMDLSFLNDYLHADYGGPATDYIAVGQTGDIVGDSTKFILAGSGGAGNQLDKDLLIPINGAVTAFHEDATPSNTTGVRFDSTYKVVFLGWGVEGIGDNLTGLGGMPKQLLIQRVADWFLSSATPVGDDGSAVLPDRITLDQNYPNPFNPATTIRFTVGPGAAHVTLKVYNLLGQEIRTLIDEVRPAGPGSVVWDGRDRHGREVGSGVFFYRLQAGVDVQTRKMLLLK